MSHILRREPGAGDGRARGRAPGPRPAARRVVDRRGDGGRLPQLPDTWFQNPQYAITLPAAADLVGILSLSLRPDESEPEAAGAARPGGGGGGAAGDADQAAALQAQAAELRRRWASCSKATAR